MTQHGKLLIKATHYCEAAKLSLDPFSPYAPSKEGLPDYLDKDTHNPRTSLNVEPSRFKGLKSFIKEMALNISSSIDSFINNFIKINKDTGFSLSYFLETGLEILKENSDQILNILENDDPSLFEMAGVVLNLRNSVGIILQNDDAYKFPDAKAIAYRSVVLYDNFKKYYDDLAVSKGELHDTRLKNKDPLI